MSQINYLGSSAVNAIADYLKYGGPTSYWSPSGQYSNDSLTKYLIGTKFIPASYLFQTTAPADLRGWTSGNTPASIPNFVRYSSEVGEIGVSPAAVYLRGSGQNNISFYLKSDSDYSSGSDTSAHIGVKVISDDGGGWANIPLAYYSASCNNTRPYFPKITDGERSKGILGYTTGTGSIFTYVSATEYLPKATTVDPGLMTAEDKKKLDTVGEGANVKSVNSKTGIVTLTKSDIGLSNVDNTADSSKSVASAAKLTTTHTINGVSFDGSKDVTGNFTSGLKEAYLEWGGRDRTSNSPIDACLYDYGRANRLAFGNPAGITIEYSRDGGATWVDYGLSDEGKQAIFSTESHLVIGKSSANQFATADCMLRATLESTAFGLYTVLNKFLIYVTTYGSSGCYCRIEGATSDNPTEFKVITTNDNIQGWSGTNTLNTQVVFGSGTGQIKYLRFIFGCTAHTNTTYYGLYISRIYGYGGEGWLTPSTMASTGRLYKIDSSQKASFPATVSATSFQVNNEEYAEAVTDTEITTMLNDLGI